MCVGPWVRGFLLICLPVCVRGSLGVAVCVGFWACVCAWVLGFLLICVPVRGYLGPCVRGCAQFCPW